MTTASLFAAMAQRQRGTDSSAAFMTVCVLSLVWLATGPVFRWSDTWQLIFSTLTNIVSMADDLLDSEHSESQECGHGLPEIKRNHIARSH